MGRSLHHAQDPLLHTSDEGFNALFGLLHLVLNSSVAHTSPNLGGVYGVTVFIPLLIGQHIVRTIILFA